MTYNIPLLRPRRHKGPEKIFLWRLEGSPDSWRAVPREGASRYENLFYDMVVATRGYSRDI